MYLQLLRHEEFVSAFLLLGSIIRIYNAPARLSKIGYLSSLSPSMRNIQLWPLQHKILLRAACRVVS